MVGLLAFWAFLIGGHSSQIPSNLRYFMLSFFLLTFIPILECTSLLFSQPRSLWGCVLKQSSDLIHGNNSCFLKGFFHVKHFTDLVHGSPCRTWGTSEETLTCGGAGLRSEGRNCSVLLLKILLAETYCSLYNGLLFLWVRWCIAWPQHTFLWLISFPSNLKSRRF